MYRDDRGSIYHPHTHETILLGTLLVEVYEPPNWTFNKVLYIEKEGFFQLLQDVNWPEKQDCALLSSKGNASRAARDLIDSLKDRQEEITFYCVHDADAYGTMIYQALQKATKARPARKVRVENLGLEPKEGLDMGLVPEKVARKDKKEVMVADYVSSEWAEWLQTKRIELNAMTSPEFLSWLDGKMVEFGQRKLIPPESVLAAELNSKAWEMLTEDINERILMEQDAKGQIAKAFEKLKPVLDERVKVLTRDVADEITKEPEKSWRDPVLRAARDLVDEAPL